MPKKHAQIDALAVTDGDDMIIGFGRTFGPAPEANETLFGGAGNDTMSGGGGDDILHGGDGNDVLGTDAGVDQLWGDAGSDTFIFGGLWYFSENTDATRDHIMDFAAEDFISFGALNVTSFEVQDIHSGGVDWRVVAQVAGPDTTGEVAIDVTGVAPTDANIVLG